MAQVSNLRLEFGHLHCDLVEFFPALTQDIESAAYNLLSHLRQKVVGGRKSDSSLAARRSALEIVGHNSGRMTRLSLSGELTTFCRTCDKRLSACHFQSRDESLQKSLP